MRVCYLTAGPLEWASSRMRAYWPAAAMDDAIATPIQQVERDLQATGEIPGADVYVFQKLYSSNIRAAMPDDAIAVWDVCDPAWWFDPAGSREALTSVHAVTASTWALVEDFSKWANKLSVTSLPPVAFIGDCIDPAHFPIKAQHTDNDFAPMRFIWFGIYTNRVALHAAQANLERLIAEGYSIQLTIMDERPDIPHVFSTRVPFPIHFTQWSLELENEVIAAHDVALLPPYPGPWGEVKSNNKWLTALACGLPVATGLDYDALDELGSLAVARQVAVKGYQGMLNDFTAGNVAPQWTQLFEELVDDLSGHERQRALSGADTAVLATG